METQPPLLTTSVLLTNMDRQYFRSEQLEFFVTFLHEAGRRNRVSSSPVRAYHGEARNIFTYPGGDASPSKVASTIRRYPFVLQGRVVQSPIKD